MLDDLGNEWMKFQECLIESDVMLKKYKEKFKTGLIHSAEEFKKTVHTLLEDFQNNGENKNKCNVLQSTTSSTICTWMYLNWFMAR